MMSKWRGQPVTENLLADINRYGNWAKKGDPTESGKCVDQVMYKTNIFANNGEVIANIYENPEQLERGKK